MTLMTNAQLLAQLDELLLEAERRLGNYIDDGAAAVQEAADEGLLLAVRLGARVEQTARSASRTRDRLETVGVGEWAPVGDFRDDPRLEVDHDG